MNSVTKIILFLFHEMKFGKISADRAITHAQKFQLTFNCSKSTIETLEKGVEFVQS